MQKESLYVRLNNKIIGELYRDSNGKFCFEYNDSVSQAISLSLPVDKKIYNYEECKGFFNGLLPESDNVRRTIGKKYGINYKNDFSLLKSIGYDCAGAISFSGTENNYFELNLPEYFEIKGKILSDNELEKFISELPKKPLALSIDGMKLSLAGAQDKTAVILIDNKIAIPDKYVPTTHILKPQIKELQETVQNEYICMKAAQKLNIIVPDVQIRTVNGKEYFLVERYDREIKNNKLKRIHQEDFCQASNIVSAYKYQSEGGVCYKDCFNILKKTSRPAVSIVRFLNLMIFNYLIGNNDAHGKNYSILHKDNSEIELAPAYDILSTRVYDNLSKKMAMKIGGYYESEKIFPHHFERFANETGISYTQLKKIIKEQAFILPDIIEEIIYSFDNTIGKSISDIVNKNCENVFKRFKF
ncbi:MAG: type II toxin-antitoxin system HipA family toxin [Candidatus Gastranaerophilales bacterium]|nr:type II toxin-antitoxin system HipA family toxin [Candidatus Gastranaerophilales bacterium]